MGAVNDRRIDTRCAYGAREGINCEFVVEAASEFPRLDDNLEPSVLNDDVKLN